MGNSTDSRKGPTNSIEGGTTTSTTERPTIKLKKSTSKLAESITSSRADSPASSAQEDPKEPPPAPLSPVPDNMQRCKHCKTAVERNMLAAHSKQCDKAKAERLKKKREKSGLPPDVPLPEEIVTPTSAKTEKDGTGKKRKADDSTSLVGDKPPTKKQKKKEEAAAKAAANGDKPKGTGGTGGKPKGPVDVEKQCGVPLPNGALCARSLTCKSHAMGAKRAVPGRSAPYDVLLANYQKKNQAKQQRQAMQMAGAAAGAGAGDDADFVDDAKGPIDSDEERDAVMSGIARAAPKPLAWKWSGSVASRYKGIRIKEMLAGALQGNRGGGLFSTVPSTMSTGMGQANGVMDGERKQGQGGAANAGGSVSRQGSLNVRKGSSGTGITA